MTTTTPIPELMRVFFMLNGISEHESVTLKPWYGHALQAILLNAIRHSYSPRYSAYLHEPNQLRPYTVSTLFPVSDDNKNFLFEITTLNQETSKALLECIIPGGLLSSDSKLDVSDIILSIKSVNIDEACRYSDLLSKEVIEVNTLNKSIQMQLKTPTFFKDTVTKKTISQLSTALLFNSLLSKWEALSETDIPSGFQDFLAESVFLIPTKLIKTKINVGKRIRLGLKGEFSIYSNDPFGEFWQFTNCLARFATFSGVGKDTSTGFGKIRLIGY